MLRWAYASIVLCMGLALTWLGAKLVLLAGSPYYVFAGMLLSCTSVCVALRRWTAVWLYAAYLGATTLWWLWESDVDFWSFLPRLALPIIVGLWMLTPFFRRSMGKTTELPFGRTIWCGLVGAALVAIGMLYWLDRAPDAQTTQWQAFAEPRGDGGDWRHYGNDLGGSRFSPLAQITPQNVGALKVVWTYHAGAAPDGKPVSFEVNPLKIGNLVYICTGYNDVIALDAETGKQAWRFSAKAQLESVPARHCRGVAYYQSRVAQGICANRIFTATVDARLIALDGLTGKPCKAFGRNGQVDLLEGMGNVVKGYYLVTSPPIVVRGKVVVGGWVTDGQSTGEPAGVIRAYDAKTGAFAWAFDPGNPAFTGMPKVGDSFTRGTPNSWAPMSGDEALGTVYVPMGNATPDYVGMHRTFNDDRFSSSVVAVNAETGQVRWTFQTTHHDLWDYDVGSQPVLINLNGIPALVQPTKRGQIFVLDRRTGRPFFPVVERTVSTDGAPGERFAPTQPFSPALPDFAGPPPTEAKMWGLTPFDQLICRIRFREARFDGTITPVGLDRSTITWPGYIGGIDWGSVAVDPVRKIMIVNNNQISNYNRLLRRGEANRRGLRPITPEHQTYVGGAVPQRGTPYAADVAPFLSPIGLPCQQPPLGMVSGVDLQTGKMVWSHPLGTSRDSGPFGVAVQLPISMGTPNLGGSSVTAGGVTFIGAAKERTIRAYDTQTGRKLWQARLPASAQSTPSIYWSKASGRQFVVVPAGGYPGFSPPVSDTLVAYALPVK
jgi:quinoprotein glucose dehydrogenase